MVQGEAMKQMLCLFILLFGAANLALANNVFNGKEVYLKECISCHGSDGTGEMPGLPNFVESNVLFKSDAELINVINDGKGTMPGYNGLLTDEQIRDVVAYLRTFL